MKGILPVVVLLAILVFWPTRSFSQNSDPRLRDIHSPKTKAVFEKPPSNLTWQNPNHQFIEYVFRDQVVEVEPNFRVHPSNAVQSEEVPLTRGSNPNILFGSADVFFPNNNGSSNGVYVSTDGGNNWFGHDSCMTYSQLDYGVDPGPGVGADGRLYMSYQASGYIKAAYSTDYGDTWLGVTILQSGSMDKTLTAVDNISGSPYYGNAYVAWSDLNLGSISVSRTTNGGVTWAQHQYVNSSEANHFSHGANPVVGPDGNVFIAYQNQTNSPPYTGDFVGLAKSTNGGAGWTHNNNIYDCNGISGNLFFTGSDQIRVNSYPSLAIDNSGGYRNGWMYIVTAEKSLAPAGNDPDIVMHVSTDGGITWSGGVRVNQDALNNGQYQYAPAVCVGYDGAVNVVYYDTRNATLTGTTPDSAQVFISRSTDGGNSFEDFMVSDHSFKPKPFPQQPFVSGENIGIVESNGKVYPFWSDDITGIYQVWTTRVTFATPCGVETASDPNPPSGAVDIDTMLSQLTWTNGAGANINELYFGTDPSSLTLVQYGSLSTSWKITPNYLPLEYYTTYYWKIVEIGDTCSSITTFNFRTVQDPNFQLLSDTLYPQSAQYWTGNTEGSTKTDGEINTINPNVGWAVFDISTISSTDSITGITFGGYVNATLWPFWASTPMGNINPLYASASDINAQILTHYEQNLAYTYGLESEYFTTGWHEWQLGNTAVPDLQQAVSASQGWFAIGIIDVDFVPDFFINFDGWSQPNPPYIIVNHYHYGNIPIELTSFTANTNYANVLLNWQTASETNNKGFEIERLKDYKIKRLQDWDRIGYVEGNGTSTKTHSYSFIDKNVNDGKYSYRLKQIDFDGKSEYSKEVEVIVYAPAAFALEQNYPNPFNPATTINYSIPIDQHVILNVYNMLGQNVMTLVNEMEKAGQHQIKFDASIFASGVYFYKLEAGNQTQIKKMILMK